ncbi:helix-turn-helix domain-containing protein, partial [Shigella boydii]
MQTQNVITEKERKIRSRDLTENAKKLAHERREAEKNSNFTQVSPLGWKRL